MPKKDFKYDSETGDVIDPNTEALPAFEPLRIPGCIDRFLDLYIPAPDPHSAQEWIGLSELRSMYGLWVPFGARIDPAQEFLNALANHGFYLQDTGCGTMALCVIRKDSPRVINPYQEVEEVE